MTKEDNQQAQFKNMVQEKVFLRRVYLGRNLQALENWSLQAKLVSLSDAAITPMQVPFKRRFNLAKIN